MVHVYSENSGDIRHFNYQHFNFNISLTIFPFIGPPTLDVLVAKAFFTIAQNVLGFNYTLNHGAPNSDLSYFPPDHGPLRYSLAPYRIFKHSIYMRDSGAISRRFYIFGIFSKPYLLVGFSIVAFLLLLAFLMKRSGLLRNGTSDAFMSIFNVLVSNGEVDTRSTSCPFKMILLVFALTNMITWMALESFLTAEQVMRPLKKPFKSLQELIHLGTIDLCVRPRSMIYRYILETEHHSNVRTILNGDQCPSTCRTRQCYADLICGIRDRISFVDGNNFASEYYSTKQSHFLCKIVQVVENIYSFPVSFVYRPGFPLKEDFNRLFIRMSEVGIQDLLERKHANQFEHFQKPTVQNDAFSDVRFPEVTFYMISSPFHTLMVLITIAWLTEMCRALAKVDWVRKLQQLRARFRYLVAYVQLKSEKIRFSREIRRIRRIRSRMMNFSGRNQVQTEKLD